MLAPTVMRGMFGLLVAISSLLPVAGAALEISVHRNDLGPFGQSTLVHLSGEIELGDTARLSAELARLPHTPGSALHVVFNSPGGSLIEGLALGRLIADQSTTVTTDVGDDNLGAGICASACVLAYLGGHYRYLREGSGIGIHQFYLGDDDALAGAEGVAIGQVLSAEIVAFLTEMRVDPNFFRLMTEAGPDDIAWVPREELERTRVVTGPIFDQAAEYKNAEGIYYLLLWQQSYWGENKLIVTCDEQNRPLFMAYLQPPDLGFVDAVPHELTVMVDGVEQATMTWGYLGVDERWAMAGFALSPGQLTAVTRAQSFGARMQPPGTDVYFGFEFQITDSKVRDTIEGCLVRGGAQGVASTPNLAGEMTVLPGRDFLGGDLTAEGVRGVSFAECQAICLREQACVAVTWIERSEWCWPKGTLGDYRNTDGLMSAIRN